MPTEQSKTKRPVVSKHVRFEVFKRDGFTCQYCQRSGLDVILHLDHKTPLCMGGTSGTDNLITACEDCNLGKSGVPLDMASPRLRRFTAPKARPALTVGDGHSLGQHAVYEAMWGAGVQSIDGSKTLVIGISTLAKIARISENRCRENVKGLVEKMAVVAVEDARCAERIGKTYRVRSESEIMSLRRAAGLVWVLRSKGAMLITAPTP